MNGASKCHRLHIALRRPYTRAELGAACLTRRASANVDAEAPRAARRLCIGGSLIGSIKETQEMLDFCGKHNLTCDVEVRKKKYGSAPDGSPKPLLTLTVTLSTCCTGGAHRLREHGHGAPAEERRALPLLHRRAGLAAAGVRIG